MTGVPATTLRVWERRYGVPKPLRARNSYRLYSENDIEMIRAMAARCAEGAAPSEAARAVVAEVDDGFEKQVAKKLVSQMLEAARSMQIDRIEALLQRSLIVGSGFEVYCEVLGPVLHEIGEAWARQEMGIAEANLVADSVVNVVRELVRLSQPHRSQYRILMACPVYEMHEGPMLAASLYATHVGWRTLTMGQQTPPQALQASIQKLDPDAIGVSWTLPPDIGYADALLAQYGTVCAGRRWIVGGRAVQMYRDHIRHYGGEVSNSLEEFEAFLRSIDAGHPFS